MSDLGNVCSKIKNELKGVPLHRQPGFVFKKARFKLVTRLRDVSVQKKLARVVENQDNPRSVFFFTTHKCASTFVKNLFDTLLKGSDYEFVDYGRAIEKMGDRFTFGDPSDLSLQKFQEEAYTDLYSLKGRVYGPERNGFDFPGRERFKHIFFLRDPRDVLVSGYYSLVYTHAEPRNAASRDEFVERRDRVQEQGIDRYALEAAEAWILPLYTQYEKLRESSESHIYLKYDLFAEDTEKFVRSICDYLGLEPSDGMIDKIVTEASPVQRTEVMRHKRSGKSGQYLEKLQPDTISKLNTRLSSILDVWGFEE